MELVIWLSLKRLEKQIGIWMVVGWCGGLQGNLGAGSTHFYKCAYGVGDHTEGGGRCGKNRRAIPTQSHDCAYGDGHGEP